MVYLIGIVPEEILYVRNITLKLILAVCNTRFIKYYQVSKKIIPPTKKLCILNAKTFAIKNVKCSLTK